jgi:hypothetical protein
MISPWSCRSVVHIATEKNDQGIHPRPSGLWTFYKSDTSRRGHRGHPLPSIVRSPTPYEAVSWLLSNGRR